MKVKVISESRIIGEDPEMADMGNPNGDIIRDVYFVIVIFNNGRVLAHFHSSMDKDSIQNLAKKIESHLSKGGSINMKHWEEHTPVYGSDYWVKSGAERDLILWEKRQD